MLGVILKCFSFPPDYHFNEIWFLPSQKELIFLAGHVGVNNSRLTSYMSIERGRALKVFFFPDSIF